MRTLVVLIAFALTSYGQRHFIEHVDAEKPEGKLLQQIMQEDDQAKKSALLEQFAGQFPKHEGMPWVLEQLQGIYAASNQPDKVIAAGDKLLALDPDDTGAGFQSLKAAQAKKDAALILKYAVATSAAARKMAAAPKPNDADEATAWKQAVDYAKQVDTYTEYALYAAALESRDPKATIGLCEALQQRGPTGEYAVKAVQPLFAAYYQAGESEKAVALAERVLATDQTNEEMMLAVADSYLTKKTDLEKAHAYCTKVVELMAARPKPEGASDAAWIAHKNLVMGRAHYLNGKVYYAENDFSKADQVLQTALPLVESDAALKPEVLFLLGFANYKLEKIQEAANYYRACAAIQSPFQTSAANNLRAIQKQYHNVK
jgi:tetratricopeptide (TPR) repeat protein